MGGTCSPHGRHEKFVKKFDRKSRRLENTWETDFHEKITLKCMLKCVIVLTGFNWLRIGFGGWLL
jgi:hypothetical protein